MSNNSFFNLFTYNEYVKDIYNTNKLAHFENILEQNEFILSEEGEKSFIDPEIKAEMIDMRTDIDNTLFEDFLKSNDRSDDKFKIINERISLLNIPIEDDGILTTYKDYLMSARTLTNHLNVIRFFKSDDYIKYKVNTIHENNFKVKMFYDVYNKIKNHIIPRRRF